LTHELSLVAALQNRSTFVMDSSLLMKRNIIHGYSILGEFKYAVNKDQTYCTQYVSYIMPACTIYRTQDYETIHTLFVVIKASLLTMDDISHLEKTLFYGHRSLLANDG
jgi:hypothetical protein